MIDRVDLLTWMQANFAVSLATLVLVTILGFVVVRRLK